MIAHHIITSIHSHLSRGLHSPARGASAATWGRAHRRTEFGGADVAEFSVGRAVTTAPLAPTHEFQCVYARPSALLNIESLRVAAGSAPTGMPTLLVTETSGSQTVRAQVARGGGSEESEGHEDGEGGGGAGNGAAPLADPAEALRRAAAQPAPAAVQLFPRALRVVDFFPYWDAVEIFDAYGRLTLAYDEVQQLVCSAAQHVHGEASRPFMHSVCHWRRAGVFARLREKSTSRVGGDTCTLLDTKRRARGPHMPGSTLT